MLSPSLLAVLTAIRWQDAAVLAADMLRAAVLMVLSPLGQRPQRFTGFQMLEEVESHPDVLPPQFHNLTNEPWRARSRANVSATSNSLLTRVFP